MKLKTSHKPVNHCIIDILTADFSYLLVTSFIFIRTCKKFFCTLPVSVSYALEFGVVGLQKISVFWVVVNHYKLNFNR